MPNGCRGGFDIDGVLALLDTALLAAFQRQGRLLDRSEADRHTYDLCESFPEISAAELAQLYESTAFLEQVAVCPWLLEAARALTQQGVELHLVTARRRPTWAITREWLVRWAVPHTVLSFVPAPEKAEYVRAHELAFFVEDRLDTALAIAPYAASFLVAHPHNHLPPGPLPPNLWRWEREQFLALPGWLHAYPPPRRPECE